MEVGTLKELNVKPGDVVEYIPDGARGVIDDNLIWRQAGGASSQSVKTSNYRDWRIISRPAHQGPVRTVTRKEIVPGVYGHIWIDRVDGDIAVIGMRNNALKKMDTVGMSADELTAAIETLTLIRDALDHA